MIGQILKLLLGVGRVWKCGIKKVSYSACWQINWYNYFKRSLMVHSWVCMHAFVWVFVVCVCIHALHGGGYAWVGVCTCISMYMCMWCVFVHVGGVRGCVCICVCICEVGVYSCISEWVWMKVCACMHVYEEQPSMSMYRGISSAPKYDHSKMIYRKVDEL